MDKISPKNKKPLGSVGENIAANYLKRNGYRILERNFTNTFGKKLGEIDIIAKKGACFVFIEVKTRSFSLSMPEENINKTKIKKLSKIINIYISCNNLWNSEWQIDAISIIIDKNSGKYKLKHLKNIFL